MKKLFLGLALLWASEALATSTVSEPKWAVDVARSGAVQRTVTYDKSGVPTAQEAFDKCQNEELPEPEATTTTTTGNYTWACRNVRLQVVQSFGANPPPPVDCVVSDWGLLTPETCPSSGEQTHTRTVVTPAANGGAACPALTENVPCTYVPPAATWVDCADEDGTCQVPNPPRQVRYGCEPPMTGPFMSCPAGGAWNTITVTTSSIVCANGNFGTPADPIDGVEKKCQYSTSGDEPPPTDTDGDGVPDSTDQCDTQAGPASNNGCPVPPPTDTDGDGVPDSTDQCDNEAGPASNNGCPEQQGSNWPQPPMTGMPVVNASSDWITLNAGSNTENIGPTGVSVGQGDGTGAFRITCDPSHMNFDDPLIYPGAANKGRAHHHTFWGNTSTWAGTNLDNLRSVGGSTCAGGTANMSAYWIPSLIDTRDGHPIAPSFIITYYKSGYGNTGSLSQIVMPPVGLKMLAGIPMKNTPYDDSEVGRPVFHCHGGGFNPQQTIPNCPVGQSVLVSLEFPTCWDGVNLDSVDHRAHTTYPQRHGFTCPSSHPVRIPAITYSIYYDVHAGDDPSKWVYSSDLKRSDGTYLPGMSFHGDWINGWKPEVAQLWLNNCVKAALDCHANLLGNGTALQ